MKRDANEGKHCSFHLPPFDVCTYIWASLRQNLSLGFPSKRDSNQSPQLQRLAGILKFRLKQV